MKIKAWIKDETAIKWPLDEIVYSVADCSQNWILGTQLITVYSDVILEEKKKGEAVCTLSEKSLIHFLL